MIKYMPEGHGWPKRKPKQLTSRFFLSMEENKENQPNILWQ